MSSISNVLAGSDIGKLYGYRGGGPWDSIARVTS
jgi:hypothetical protein